MARLGEVCTFFTGTGFPNQYQGNTNGEYPFFKVGDISRNVQMGQRTLEYCDNYINDETVKIIRGTIIPQGTVVFAKIGEALRLNRRAITTCKCLIDNNVMGLKPIGGVLTTEYFYYLMTAIDLQKYCEATTVPSVRKSTLERVEIAVPSIEEQNRIVDILNKLNDLISLRKQQLAKLDELVKARFVEMFGDPVQNSKGWPLTSIGDIAEIRIGPFGTMLHKEDYIEGGHALVNPSHIVDGKISTDPKLTISDEKYGELISYALQVGDIVLGRRGEMGRCAVVYENGLLCGTGSMIIRPNGQIKPYFLQNILSNPTYKKIIEDKAVGVTMMNLNIPIVSKLKVPQLPIALQDTFIEFMTKIDKQKLTIQQSLGKLEVLKKSLMQEYFG